MLEIDAFLSHDYCQSHLCQDDTFQVLIATEQDVEIGGGNLTMRVLSLVLMVFSYVNVGHWWLYFAIHDIGPSEFVAVECLKLRKVYVDGAMNPFVLDKAPISKCTSNPSVNSPF